MKKGKIFEIYGTFKYFVMHLINFIENLLLNSGHETARKKNELWFCFRFYLKNIISHT